jgi:hypothetical protein
MVRGGPIQPIQTPFEEQNMKRSMLIALALSAG